MNRRELIRAVAGVGALAALGACSPADASDVSTTSSNTTPPPTAANGPSTTTVESSTTPATAQPTGSSAPATDVSGTTVIAGWTPGTPATYVNSGPSDSSLVALTFHLAGATPLVTRLLDLLQANAVRSTLFAIGDWLGAHPTLAQRALTDGHELGNHTKSHQAMLELDRAHVHAEIAGGAEALVPFIGSIGKWFRPSGTDVPTPMILEEAGKVGYPVSVGYSIDSRDYTEPGAHAVIDNVVGSLRPGAIVSLHFGHADTLSALPSILDHIATLGLRTATITELLAPAPSS